MNARRDALAHKFVANVLAETRGWPPRLQVGLHQLAFADLPEAVLSLDADDARAWARRWRREIEGLMAAPPVRPRDEDLARIAELAAEWLAARPSPEQPAGPEEIARLADLMARLGPLALGLPWRRQPPPRA